MSLKKKKEQWFFLFTSASVVEQLDGVQRLCGPVWPLDLDPEADPGHEDGTVSPGDLGKDLEGPFHPESGAAGGPGLLVRPRLHADQSESGSGSGRVARTGLHRHHVRRVQVATWRRKKN